MPEKQAVVKRIESDGLDALNHKGNNVQLAVDLFGMAELPLGGFCGPAEVGRHIAGNARNVKNGVALKNLGQAIGEVAGQAFAGALAQFKGQLGLLRLYATADKPNVVSAFFSAAKQRFEKIIRPRSRKYLIQENLIQILRSHALPHQVTGFAVVEKKTADQTPAVKA